MKFPSFKLSAAWRKLLYGSPKSPPVELKQGQLSMHAHPHLNHLNVSLDWDGVVNYNGPDFSLRVAPVDFSLKAGKLLRADGLQLLRGEDSEVGVSFDKKSSRHFFFLGWAPSSPKFSISFKVYNALTASNISITFYTDRRS